MSSLPKVSQAALRALESQFFEEIGRDRLGGGVSVWSGETEILCLSGGFRDRARTHAWTADTLVPIWSCTKGLAAAATLSSALLWQRDYTRRVAHLDADRYAESAARMAAGLADPALRPAAAAWFRAYPHASTQLVPALLVPFVWLGLPASFAFMLLSALAAWLALLATWRIAVAHLG